jgi:peptide/nickel transport system substrate-binding protein
MRAGRQAAAFLVLALLTCGCPSHKRLEPSPSSTAPREPSGTLTIAYPAEPATLNPFVPAGDTPATRDLARMLMPGLFKVTPDGARAAWLLDAVPTESNGPPFNVTVTLRNDALWSDGTSITVDDLRFTWQFAARNQIARAGYDQIARIVTLTPKSARIEFKTPFRRWRDLFSAGLGVLPAHALSTPRRLASLSSGWPVSGGPFVLKAWHRGLDMIFDPNPHAWAGTPLLKRIRVVFVPDALGALQLFKNGKVDALGPYDAPDWTARVGSGVATDSGQTWMGVVLNTRSRVLADVKVRQAFADSIDRARLVRGLVQREGGGLDAIPPATTRPFARYSDLSRARTTLAADGWAGSGIRTRRGTKLSFTIAVADSDGLGQVLARAITYQAARAGIDVQSVSLPIDEIMSKWLPGARFDAAIMEWRDPPEGAVRARFASGGKVFNVARLADGTLNRDLASEDASQATVAAEASQARLAAVLPVLPLATLVVSLVSSARAHGLLANAEADGPFWNAEQWSVS